MTGFLTRVESCSPTIMEHLAKFAFENGLENNPYIEVHSGALEEHHAAILLEGLIDETSVSKTDYSDAFIGLKKWSEMVQFIFKN